MDGYKCPVYAEGIRKYLFLEELDPSYTSSKTPTPICDITFKKLLKFYENSHKTPF